MHSTNRLVQAGSHPKLTRQCLEVVHIHHTHVLLFRYHHHHVRVTWKLPLLPASQARAPAAPLHRRPHLQSDNTPASASNSATSSHWTDRQSFNGPLSGTTRVSWYQKGKTNLDLLEQETVTVAVASTGHICTSSRQITTPASHHSVFYRPDALPAAQPTVSKYWRQNVITLGSTTIIVIQTKGTTWLQKAEQSKTRWHSVERIPLSCPLKSAQCRYYFPIMRHDWFFPTELLLFRLVEYWTMHITIKYSEYIQSDFHYSSLIDSPSIPTISQKSTHNIFSYSANNNMQQLQQQFYVHYAGQPILVLASTSKSRTEEFCSAKLTAHIPLIMATTAFGLGLHTIH